MNFTILLLIVSVISLLPVFFIKKYLNSNIKSNLYLAGFFYIVLLYIQMKVKAADVSSLKNGYAFKTD